MSGTMKPADVDPAIARLRETVVHVGDRLYRLDSDPGRSLLAAGPLDGVTAAGWSAVAPTIDGLWAQYSALVNHRDRVIAARRNDRRLSAETLAELTRLLGGPVALPDGFDGTAPPPIELPELVAAIERGLDVAAAFVGRVDTVRDAALQRIAPLDDRLTALQAAESAAGVTLASTTAALEGVAHVRRLLALDPLGLVDDTFRSLEHHVQVAAEVSTKAVMARAALADRLAGARLRLDGVEDLLRRACEAEGIAAEKIAGSIPGGDTASAVQLDRLRANLAAHVALAGADWQTANRRLDELLVETDALSAQLTARLDAATGKVGTRNELRGRLDGYRAKATASGRVEDPVLRDLYHEARTLLYTAPCDLVAASTAVGRYQDAVRGLRASVTHDAVVTTHEAQGGLRR